MRVPASLARSDEFGLLRKMITAKRGQNLSAETVLTAVRCREAAPAQEVTIGSTATAGDLTTSATGVAARPGHGLRRSAAIQVGRSGYFPKDVRHLRLRVGSLRHRLAGAGFRYGIGRVDWFLVANRPLDASTLRGVGQRMVDTRTVAMENDLR